MCVCVQAQLQTTNTESSEAEQVLQGQVRQGRLELDEARRGASWLGQEQRELSLRLEETERERDSLTLSNTQLEEARRQQEKALEKLNKEVRGRGRRRGRRRGKGRRWDERRLYREKFSFEKLKSIDADNATMKTSKVMSNIVLTTATLLLLYLSLSCPPPPSV